MSQIKCFVVNLPSATDRCQACCEHLDLLGLEYEVFSATDGQTLSPQDLDKCDLSSKSFLNLAAGRKVCMENQLSKQEFGCALSHLKLYQHILDQNLPYACVLEDDCLVKPPFKDALQAIQELDTDWELINFANANTLRSFKWGRRYLFGKRTDQYFQKVGLRNSWLDALCNPRRFMRGTFLYVISAKGCKRLLEIGYPVRFPSDILTGHVAFNRLNMLQVFPKSSHYADFDAFETLIPNRPKHDLHRA